MTVLDAIGRLYSVAATPQLIAQLVAHARDFVASHFCSDSAAIALGRTVAHLGSSEELTRLVELARDTDWGVRYRAPKAIAACGVRVASEFQAVLLELLRDPVTHVQWRTVVAVRDLGASVVSTEIMDELCKLACRPDSSLQCLAVETIGDVATQASSQVVLERLTSNPGDSSEIRYGIALAIAKVRIA